MIPEAAEPTMLDECRKCDAHPAYGVTWVEDGIIYFKCDECGNTLFEGNTEEVNREQVEKKRGYERSMENRERFMREASNKMERDYDRFRETYHVDPGKALEDDVGYVFERIIPT